MDQESDSDSFVTVTPPASPRVWKPIPGVPGSYCLADIRCCYCGEIVNTCNLTVRDINSLTCAKCKIAYDKNQRKITDYFNKSL